MFLNEMVLCCDLIHTRLVYLGTIQKTLLGGGEF